MKAIVAKDAPQAIGPYSQGVDCGDFVFVSGQLPINPENGEIPEGIAAQTNQALKNADAILKASGLSLENACKVTVYLSDISEFAEMNECYGKFFKEPCPARAAIQAAALPKGAKIEIDVIASKK
ncbi:MAG: Rid family detoxifying hydrolase [Clostridia bacterium]|nr:Rid family detoxifying hydrolase [Clostridia bacterium]